MSIFLLILFALIVVLFVKIANLRTDLTERTNKLERELRFLRKTSQTRWGRSGEKVRAGRG